MWEVKGKPPLEAGASLDKGLPQGWEVPIAAHSISWILGGDRVQHQASEGQDTLPQIWHLDKLNIEAERTFALSRSRKVPLTPSHQPFFPEAGQNTPRWNFLSPDYREDMRLSSQSRNVEPRRL